MALPVTKQAGTGKKLKSWVWRCKGRRRKNPFLENLTSQVLGISTWMEFESMRALQWEDRAWAVSGGLSALVYVTQTMSSWKEVE